MDFKLLYEEEGTYFRIHFSTCLCLYYILISLYDVLYICIISHKLDMKFLSTSNHIGVIIYLNHIRLHKTLSYHYYSLYFFTLMILNCIMYITMCLYITITILLWVLSIYPFIKHYTIVILS